MFLPARFVSHYLLLNRFIRDSSCRLFPAVISAALRSCIYFLHWAPHLPLIAHGHSAVLQCLPFILAACVLGALYPASQFVITSQVAAQPGCRPHDQDCTHLADWAAAHLRSACSRSYFDSCVQGHAKTNPCDADPCRFHRHPNRTSCLAPPPSPNHFGDTIASSPPHKLPPQAAECDRRS